MDFLRSPVEVFDSNETNLGLVNGFYARSWDMQPSESEQVEAVQDGMKGRIARVFLLSARPKLSSKYDGSRKK